MGSPSVLSFRGDLDGVGGNGGASLAGAVSLRLGSLLYPFRYRLFVG